MTNVPLPLAGGSMPSVPMSAQKLVNMYPRQDPGGVSEVSVYPFPGLTTFYDSSDNTSGVILGMQTFLGQLRIVRKATGAGGSTATFRTIDGGGNETNHGAIDDTTRPVGMANDGLNMLIAPNAPGSELYTFDGTTLSTLGSGPNDESVITRLNNHFITDSDDNAFHVSDAGSTTFTSGESAEPESDPDHFTAPYAFDQWLWLFGENSIEPWVNTGVGTPPFERVNGGIIEGIGTLSKHGITHTPTALYFVDKSGVAYAISGRQPQAISPPALSRLFRTYSLDEITAFVIPWDGMQFVVFSFPEATWAYAEGVDWFELDNNGAWHGVHYAYAYGKHLVGDKTSMKIHELDRDAFTWAGTAIKRRRTLHTIGGEQFNEPRRRMEMSKLRLNVSSGTGLTTGQGEFPKLMLRRSLDAGKTWGMEHWINTGTLGDFDTQIEWPHMAAGYQLTFDVAYTDPVSIAFHSAGVELRAAGD